MPSFCRSGREGLAQRDWRPHLQKTLLSIYSAARFMVPLFFFIHRKKLTKIKRAAPKTEHSILPRWEHFYFPAVAYQRDKPVDTDTITACIICDLQMTKTLLSRVFWTIIRAFLLSKPLYLKPVSTSQRGQGSSLKFFTYSAIDIHCNSTCPDRSPLSSSHPSDVNLDDEQVLKWDSKFFAWEKGGGRGQHCNSSF